MKDNSKNNIGMAKKLMRYENKLKTFKTWLS